MKSRPTTATATALDAGSPFISWFLQSKHRLTSCSESLMADKPIIPSSEPEVMSKENIFLQTEDLLFFSIFLFLFLFSSSFNFGPTDRFMFNYFFFLSSLFFAKRMELNNIWNNSIQLNPQKVKYLFTTGYIHIGFSSAVVSLMKDMKEVAETLNPSLPLPRWFLWLQIFREMFHSVAILGFFLILSCALIGLFWHHLV